MGLPAGKKGTTFYLLVTATPPGEAPLWVREKWVGIELPLMQRWSIPAFFRLQASLLVARLAFHFGCG